MADDSVTMVRAGAVLEGRRARGLAAASARMVRSYLMRSAVSAASLARFRSVRTAKSRCIAGRVSVTL